MAFSSYRNRFQGTLAGISVSELGILDRQLETLEERLRYIKNKYEKVDKFYETYIFTKEANIDGELTGEAYEKEDFAEFYKYSLNSNDSLSEDINIFQFIENDATYLLNSSDLPNETGKYSNRSDVVPLDEVIAQVEASKENYRLAPKIDIKAKDLRMSSLFAGTYENYLKNYEKSNKIKSYVDSKERVNKEKFKEKIINFDDFDFGEITKNNKLSKDQFERFQKLEIARVEILKELSIGRERLIELKMKLQEEKFDDVKKENERKKQLRYVINALKGIKSDLIYCKVAMTPIVEIEAEKCPSENNLCDSIDYTNVEHMKMALLLTPSERISSDFNIIAYDIQKAVDRLYEKGIFGEYEIELIDIYRSSNCNMSYVARELDKHKTQVYRDFDKVIEHIIKEIN
ncbi:hypothetical protein UT300003_32030 [Clostridium sardiniense]